MSPDPQAQHHAPTLIVCAGLTGYRLAYAGGTMFKTIALFPRSADAMAAKRAADQATSDLLRIAKRKAA